ncbi:MAG: DUF1285 domain-containing protein [Oligoflexia bacterium]|nr:DUF1285 domain-containing protein [Oligoflexia bacterium]
MKEKALTVINWRPEPGSKMIKTLLLQTNQERGNFWQSVTGHVEKSESFQDAALREAEEETGLKFHLPAQYLGLEQTFEGRFGRAHEKAFYLCLYGNEPPTPKLDASEHTNYFWATPSEAQQKVKYTFNIEAIQRSTMAAAPLFLNSQGVFFQEGEEITHQRTVELLHRSLKTQNQKQYYVEIEKETLDVVVEDSAYFIQNIDTEKGEGKLLYGDWASLNDLSFQGEKGAYCHLPDGRKAKFLRSAYYELTKNLEEKNGEYFLLWKNSYIKTK